jgi:signal peptidase I
MPHDPETSPLPRSRGDRWRQWARSLAGWAAFVGLMLSARASLADHYHVTSGSMEPTVATGDRVLVNKAAYGLRLPLVDRYLVEFDGPRRGDVVVLRSPTGGPVLLKRVVAVPGDRVAIRAGRLLLDGVEADLRHDDSGTWEQLGGRWHRLGLDRGGGPDLDPVRVPPRRYLVIGDHRGDSLDGRMFGWIDRGAIRGRAVAVIVRAGVLTWKPL